MAGPTHGIMGDDNFGTELPQMTPAKDDLVRERHMARFSQTKEFQVLKEAMQQRMDFWGQYAPGSNQNPARYRDLSNDERGWRSLVADVLSEEFNSILNAYEQASQVVAEAVTKDA